MTNRRILFAKVAYAKTLKALCLESYFGKWTHRTEKFLLLLVPIFIGLLWYNK